MATVRLKRIWNVLALKFQESSSERNRIVFQRAVDPVAWVLTVTPGTAIGALLSKSVAILLEELN